MVRALRSLLPVLVVGPSNDSHRFTNSVLRQVPLFSDFELKETRHYFRELFFPEPTGPTLGIVSPI